MSLIMLVLTMTDAVAQPERTERCRGDLLSRLEILKNGSLAAECRDME